MRLVVMAKPAVPGRVKTRLGSRWSGEQCARIHAAMLDCTIRRLTAHARQFGWRCVLASDAAADEAGGAGEQAVPIEVPEDWSRTTQGPGDLGKRIGSVWRQRPGATSGFTSPIGAGGDGAAAFFGADSPDVPAAMLGRLAALMSDADVVLGATADGGYWTIAASRYRPQLFAGIDWGGASVYDQTLRAADRAGLTVADAGAWFDVDAPADVDALLLRLAGAHEPALIALRDRLRQIIE